MDRGIDFKKKFIRQNIDEKLAYSTFTIEDIKNAIDNGYPFIFIVDTGKNCNINFRGIPNFSISSTLRLFANNFDNLNEAKERNLIKRITEELDGRRLVNDKYIKNN